ncbi:E3 ubiquitin ligase BIG BROTHER-like [Asparagus officinalis]|nr:E3 ubiquitin ligase BIG BROTHER-like [Asparagus officinalis]
MNVEIQLEVDEALARELQEMENQFASTSVGEAAGTASDTSSTGSSVGNAEGSSSNTSSQVAREDDIDPENMTYEELQSLTEAIGTESRGLSDELISFLPSSTYKTRLFSRKEKRDECVICYMAYKNRDKLIKLPCQHQYHKHCITRWLKINKACPVCNEEVFGS